MSLANAHQVTVPISRILSSAVDENRSLSINERFQLDTLFESLFKANKSLYHSHYAAYAAFTGEIKGLEDCANYFFAIKKEKLDTDSIQCLFAMNNAAYFEKLHSILKNYDVLEYGIPELIKVYFNASILTLNVEEAEQLFHSLKDGMVSDEQKHLFYAMIVRAKEFLNSYDETMHSDLQNYICEILNTHRKFIIPKVYKVAGPSILHPSFLNDEGKGYIALALEFISDDIDFAMDLEELFYDKINSKKYQGLVRSAVSYGLIPVSPKDPIPFAENVIEVGVL